MTTQELEKALANYFLYIEKCDEKWRAIIETTARPLQSLKNQCEQLNHVMNPAVDNAEICYINNAREKVIFKIHMAIEEEISTILSALRKLNALCQELTNKLNNLDELRSKICANDVINRTKGTAYKPQLILLLEWAIQTHKYYINTYGNINNCFKTIDKNKMDTIEQLASKFTINVMEHDKIVNILVYTQFLSNVIN